MDKQYQKQCPIDGGTCGQGGTCFVCENEALGSQLTAANARIAELAAENKAQRELLGQLHDSASEYAADQSGANDPRCGVVQPITVADGEALNDALRRAAALLEKK
ncbi:hypothetical protein [uncultured Alcanivorax sp.]|uniref:hypothetical protein n=1 Tax=uncultured Alcanivorax sp. TaxID=191215 RepID=UPI0032B2D2D3